jgi:hypothetical protein
MMFRIRLVCLSALYAAACAPSFAADMPMRSAPAACAPPIESRHVSNRRAVWRHNYSASGGQGWSGVGGGVAFGLAPGVGQLGAAGTGYYAINGCWAYEPAYDRFGNYFGVQPVNICIEMPPN